MEGRPQQDQAKNQQRREAALLGLWADARTDTGIRSTAWAGYQAVAEYVDHGAASAHHRRPRSTRAERLLATEAPRPLEVRSLATVCAR